MGFLVILSHLVGHASLYFMSLYHINITEETLQHATFSLHNILVFCCSMFRNCCFGFFAASFVFRPYSFDATTRQGSLILE